MTGTGPCCHFGASARWDKKRVWPVKLVELEDLSSVDVLWTLQGRILQDIWLAGVRRKQHRRCITLQSPNSTVGFECQCFEQAIEKLEHFCHKTLTLCGLVWRTCPLLAPLLRVLFLGAFLKAATKGPRSASGAFMTKRLTRPSYAQLTLAEGANNAEHRECMARIQFSRTSRAPSSNDFKCLVTFL